MNSFFLRVICTLHDLASNHYMVVGNCGNRVCGSHNKFTANEFRIFIDKVNIVIILSSSLADFGRF